jgi:hypothetical protein
MFVAMQGFSLVRMGLSTTTTRNTVIGCALSETVLCEPYLKHY